MRNMLDIVRNQKPVTLPPSATVRDACRYMRDRRVGAVLVIEGDNRLLGIFTGRDAVHRVLAEGKSAATTKLAEVMTPDPDTMPPGKTAIEALRLMEDGRYRHVPVVDGARVVGIVSRFDFSGLELDRLDEETGLMAEINARGRRTRKRGQLPSARPCRRGGRRSQRSLPTSNCKRGPTVEIGGCGTMSSTPALAPTP